MSILPWKPGPAGELSPRRGQGTGGSPVGWLLPYLFIMPTLVVVALIIAYPLGQALYLSLTDMSFIKPVAGFVGLKNFASILGSSTFWLVFRNSIVWTTSVVFFQFSIGLGVAVLLNQQFVGRGLVRGLIIIPWVTPGVIAALLWRMMYEPQLGIINGVLAAMHVPNPTIPWLTQGGTAMAAVIISAIWKGSPFSAVMYLAAIQGVSKDLLDASKIDGASAWSRLRYVVIPQISPVIRITVLLTTMWTANYFDIIYVMTAGGPLNQTHIFPTYVYELGFRAGKTGMASATGILTAAVLLVFSLWYVRELNKRKGLD